MDTKLRKISCSPIIKGIVFLIVIICFSFAASLFANLTRNTNWIQILEEPNYANTNELFDYQQNFYIGLYNLLNLKNEEYIKQGNMIDKQEFENRKKELFNEWYKQVINPEFNQYIKKESIGTIENEFNTYQLLKEKFEIENTDKINQIYNSMINSQLKGYYALLQRVNNKEGLYYYASNGEVTYANCDYIDKEYFKKFKAYYLLDEEGFEFSNVNKFSGKDSTYGQKIYIAAKDEYIAQKQAQWDKDSAYFKKEITIIIYLILVIFIAFVYLVWRAGRKKGDINLHLTMIDKIYTDVNVAIIFGGVLAWLVILSGFINSNFLNYDITDFANIKLDFWLVNLFNLICCSVGLMLFLSLVRHFKNKTLIKHSFIYTMFSKLHKVIKTIFNSGPLSVRVAAIILISEVVVFILTILIFSTRSVFTLFWLAVLCAVSAFGIYYVILKIKSFNDIVKGVQEIKNGKLEYAITVQGDSDLANLANDINDITNGLKDAVAKEIKAERMKSELITNVSHDLKTPLTSIINYVDLLSKEKLTPDNANEYVEVLKQKSQKLKLLTQDLFEISKVQSGNISIDIEKIDISVLVRQSLTEFDEQISLLELDFKVNIQDSDTYIMADGKRLSRVFENLISNILKYSLKNTRVYIDVFSDEDSIFIEFKNIANYAMNFKEDEILERFVRGDKARSTDGNGLGLAIAESYVVACGGNLKISVDGDLFKVTIKFNKA